MGNPPSNDNADPNLDLVREYLLAILNAAERPQRVRELVAEALAECFGGEAA